MKILQNGTRVKKGSMLKYKWQSNLLIPYESTTGNLHMNTKEKRECGKRRKTRKARREMWKKSDKDGKKKMIWRGGGGK